LIYIRFSYEIGEEILAPRKLEISDKKESLLGFALAAACCIRLKLRRSLLKVLLPRIQGFFVKKIAVLLCKMD
jgi:hypothetical protein